MVDAHPAASGSGFRARSVHAPVAALLSALLLAVSALAEPSDPRPLIVSGSGWITDAPTRLAAASGFFEDGTGRAIVVEVAESGKASLEKMKAGRADFSLMAGVPLAMELLRLHDQGTPRHEWPVVLASIGLSDSTHHLIAGSGSGIEHAQDLEGRTLGLLLGSSAHYCWDRFAGFSSIDPSSVRLVDLAPGHLEEALAAGRVDAVVTWTPYSERIVAGLGADARRFPLETDSISWLLVSTRAVIDENPAEIQRILQGYARAIELLQDDPARARQLLADPAGWEKSGRVSWKLALDWPVLFNIEQKLDWSAALQGLENPQLRPRDYIDREPLQRFRPAAVTLPLWISEEGRDR